MELKSYLIARFKVEFASRIVLYVLHNKFNVIGFKVISSEGMCECCLD